MLKNKRQYIRIKYRLRGNPKAYAYLSGLAGANRHLWNTALSKILKDYKETDKSDFSYYTLLWVSGTPSISVIKPNG